MNEQAIGKKVEAYHILGNGHDTLGRWTEADMVLDIPTAGRFLVNIVVKSAYADERVERVLSDLEDVEDAEHLIGSFSKSDLVQHQPFVLNDLEITDEILNAKFAGRTVERDLAESLWYKGPITADPSGN